MEKITRGPEIIFRGGRILRGSHGFSGVKEGGEGGGISRRQQSLKEGL